MGDRAALAGVEHVETGRTPEGAGDVRRAGLVPERSAL